MTVGRWSRDLRSLSRDRSGTFFKIFSNCLKRPKTLFDSRPMVAWPPTTVAWPFSDVPQNFLKLLETSKKRCLTVSRRSHDLRPLSHDGSATFFKNFSNCLKRLKNVVWQSSDGRVTFDHCRVTVRRLFQKNFKLLETSKNVVWQSADGRMTSDHCRVTVQRLFSKNFPSAWNVQKTLFNSRPIARVTSDHCRVTVQRLFSKFSQIACNVQKTLFDSRPMVAGLPIILAWPFRDFFQNFLKLLETSKNVVWQSAEGRVTPDHCRVTVQRLFFKNFSYCLKRPKNVLWQWADGRVTSDHCRVTVQRLSSKFFQIAWNV